MHILPDDLLEYSGLLPTGRFTSAKYRCRLAFHVSLTVAPLSTERTTIAPLETSLFERLIEQWPVVRYRHGKWSESGDRTYCIYVVGLSILRRTVFVLIFVHCNVRDGQSSRCRELEIIMFGVDFLI